MTAAIILKMIEEVSPDDAKRLDEIEARVWCYAENKEWPLEFKGMGVAPETGKSEVFLTSDGSSPGGEGMVRLADIPKYTRSRDALKAIRPGGWLCGRLSNQTLGEIWDGTAKYQWSLYRPGTGIHVGSPVFPTEELAELHAIIQAIEYEGTKA